MLSARGASITAAGHRAVSRNNLPLRSEQSCARRSGARPTARESHRLRSHVGCQAPGWHARLRSVPHLSSTTHALAMIRTAAALAAIETNRSLSICARAPRSLSDCAPDKHQKAARLAAPPTPARSQRPLVAGSGDARSARREPEFQTALEVRRGFAVDAPSELPGSFTQSNLLSVGSSSASSAHARVLRSEPLVRTQMHRTRWRTRVATPVPTLSNLHRMPASRRPVFERRPASLPGCVASLATVSTEPLTIYCAT